MSKVIKIEGGHKLNGTVRIDGSKNATVALIPAAILANEVVTIYGVPDISDVHALTNILAELNIKVTREENGDLVIDPIKMENNALVTDVVTQLRASYYFMGALLGKYSVPLDRVFVLRMSPPLLPLPTLSSHPWDLSVLIRCSSMTLEMLSLPTMALLF